MVTGSVADRVAPTLIASTKVMLRASNGVSDQTKMMMPSDQAEMKVPAKAKVKMEPMFRKKFACRLAVSWLAIQAICLADDPPDGARIPSSR